MRLKSKICILILAIKTELQIILYVACTGFHHEINTMRKPTVYINTWNSWRSYNSDVNKKKLCVSMKHEKYFCLCGIAFHKVSYTCKYSGFAFDREQPCDVG